MKSLESYIPEKQVNSEVTKKKYYSEDISSERQEEKLLKAVPIRASLVDGKNIDVITKRAINNIKKRGIAVNFYGSSSELRRHNITNQGFKTYVISEFDEQDKYSEQYYNCTGIIIAGRLDSSDQQLSLLSHQNPEVFLKDHKNQFIEDMEDHLHSLLRLVDKKTLDAVIIGGQQDYYLQEEAKVYKESIIFLSELLKKYLDVTPTILTGPNLEIGYTNIYYNTQHRRLYLVRPFQSNNAANQAYQLQNYKKQAQKWN